MENFLFETLFKRKNYLCKTIFKKKIILDKMVAIIADSLFPIVHLILFFDAYTYSKNNRGWRS